MKLTLHVWRQKGPHDQGNFETHQADEVSPDMSFLEMLDTVNERLAREGKDIIAFDYDCREGICGSCAMVVNGIAHGPERMTTVCQLHMRKFHDGEHLYIEPWRAKAFPILKDLVTDRSAFDRVIQAGGYVSVNTGGTPDGNAMLVPKPDQEEAMDAAECIACGACVAACPNASGMLFLAAKVSHLAMLPQGGPERGERARNMVEAHDREGFGHCSNNYECEAACPKGISVRHITRLNREYLRATVAGPSESHAE